MKDLGKFLVACLIGLIFLAALTFLSGGMSLSMKKFFGIREANIEREIFENGKSFVHGAVQDLAQRKLEYDRAESKTEKEAIKAMVRNRFSMLDEKKIPEDLQYFLYECRGF